MATLTAVRRGDCWRIQMSWPDRMPRFFGEFETEAARWIKEHSWLGADKAESADRNPSSVDEEV